MKFGLYACNYGVFGDPRNLLKIGEAAENAGWDGFFLWDHINPTKKDVEVVDPWIGLAAISMNTKKIRIGTTVTPVPRRRPRKLAKEIVSIDQLSNGRFTLGVGIGAPEDGEYKLFGEHVNKSKRGYMLDEGLEMMTRMWSGEEITFDGNYFKIRRPTRFLPKPIQHPRVPIWVGGFWNYKTNRPFKRAAKWDGVIPILSDFQGKTKFEVFKDIRNFILKYRGSDKNFDIVNLETIPKSKSKLRKALEQYIEDGAVNWWLHSAYNWWNKSLAETIEEIEKGPPQF